MQVHAIGHAYGFRSVRKQARYGDALFETSLAGHIRTHLSGGTMDSDLSQFVPQVGTDVIGADGEKVGEIDAVERDYFIVRKGFFFPQDHYIPLTAVSSYDAATVYLNVTRDEALEQEWTTPPVARDVGYEAVDTDRGADGAAANTTLGTPGDAPRAGDTFHANACRPYAAAEFAATIPFDRRRSRPSDPNNEQ